MSGHAGHRPALVHGDGRLVPLLVEIAVQVHLRVGGDAAGRLPLRAEVETVVAGQHLDPVRVGARFRRVARVGAQEQRAVRAAREQELRAEAGHRAGLGEHVRPYHLVRLPVVRRVVPGERAQRMARPERHRGAGLRAPGPGLRVGPQRAAAREFGRGAVEHPPVRRHQRRLRVGALLGQRAAVAVARRREALTAFEGAAVVAIVRGRGEVRRQAAPHLDLAVQIAARLQRPGQHLAAAHALRLDRQVPAQDPRAPRPVLVDEVRVRLIQRHLRVGGGRRRLHRFIQAIGQHHVAATRIDAGQPQLLHPLGGVLPQLQLADVVLALRLVVASQDVERLAAQVVNLRIRGVVLEVMGALERGDRVVELSGRRRGARGVALGGRVARQQLQHLFQLATRAIEVAAQEIVVRLLAQLFGVRRRRRQPQYRENQPAPHHSATRFLQRSCPHRAAQPRRRLCLMRTW